jgi:GMP synthase (glutamine-hydrolysing)
MKPKVRVMDCGSKKVPQIIEMLEPLCAGVETLAMERGNTADWQGIDVLVISGGTPLFTDEVKYPGLRDNFSFLEQLNIPILGICLGHQAIGLHHGAKIFRGKEIREPYPIELLKDHPLLKGLSSPASFTESHVEGISLPSGFSLLARSRDYPVEAMANDELRRYGVQFHPEVSGENGKILFNNFIEMLK